MDTTLTILDQQKDVVIVGDDRGNISFLHESLLFTLKDVHNIIVKTPSFVAMGIRSISLYCLTSTSKNIEEEDGGEFERYTIDVRNYQFRASIPCAFDEHSKKWFTYDA